MKVYNIRTKRDIIYQSSKTSKGLSSILLIFKRSKELNNGKCLVPRWLVVLNFLLMSLIISVLIAALLIVTFAPRPANYQENCKGRSCAKEGNMKCINNVCTCTGSQYYLNKCVEKKSYLEKCSRSYQCKDYLSCIGGTCQCNETKYYIENNCINRKSYMETCIGDQCLANSLMYCNETMGKCVCSSKRFIDNNICVLKRWSNERCTKDNECDETKQLTCVNGKCSCNSTYFYFDLTSLTCLPKLNEYISCKSTSQCLGPMQCTNNKCQCSTTEYFDVSTLSCLPRTLNNTSCASNNTCRVDLGLSCQNNLCQCDISSQFWLASSGRCVNFLTYSGIGCTIDGNCISSQNLICNLNAAANRCNCPTTSTNGMCDCHRINGSEYYWDSSVSKCVPAVGYGISCGPLNSNYKCRTITDYLFCSGNICSLVQRNGACSIDAQCDYYKGLVCISNTCICSNDYYWNTTLNKCILRTGYFTDCTTSTTCYLNLTCTDGKCICPSSQGYNAVTKTCVNCRAGWFGYDERCYKIHTSAAIWDNANSTCATDSSWLYFPNSMRELVMIDSKLSIDIWIGVYTTIPNTGCANPFYSVSNFEAIFFNWNPIQPNCSGGDQYCVKQQSDQTFNDFWCYYQFQYACEYAP